MLSRLSQAVIVAYDKGYRVVNNEVVSPFWPRPLKCHLKDGYWYFTINTQVIGMRRTRVPVHRIMAYQKFGSKIFEFGISIRHLDGNSRNNLRYNITTGSHSDNMRDIPAEVRLSKAVKAATAIRKFTDVEVEEIRHYHKGSYKDTMVMFGITSKGTLHYILNNNYITEVV